MSLLILKVVLKRVRDVQYSYLSCVKDNSEFWLSHLSVSLTGDDTREGRIRLLYRGNDKPLARLTSRCILFDGENISFDTSLVIYIHK